MHVKFMMIPESCQQIKLYFLRTTSAVAQSRVRTNGSVAEEFFPGNRMSVANLLFLNENTQSGVVVRSTDQNEVTKLYGNSI